MGKMAWRAVRSDASMNDLMSHQFMKDVDGGPARWLLASPAGSQAKRGSNKVEGKPKNEIAGGGAIGSGGWRGRWPA